MPSVRQSMFVDKNSIHVDERQQYRKVADTFIYFSDFKPELRKPNLPFFVSMSRFTLMWSVLHCLSIVGANNFAIQARG